MANFHAEYSVLKPPTNSCSASTRSKGGRFISAVAEIRKMMNGTNPSRTRFQCQTAPNWSLTITLVEREPVTSTTAATDRPRAASYDTIWAEARTPPSSGYLEPDDQPASITP